MSLTPKKLFLIDSLGALLTALMTGVVLTTLEAHIGMPVKTLYYLAMIACIFAVYSLWNHLKMKPNWPFFMKIIAIANLTYCSATFALAIYHRETVTLLGFIYFALEVAVVVALATIELKTARIKNNHSNTPAK
ncbi:hypothetical protein BKI52_43370 [marine bacterium AO1-C]|nr:hypothetical protein BKI52_43370 [marine bacterium AO1-C]